MSVADPEPKSDALVQDAYLKNTAELNELHDRLSLQ